MKRITLLLFALFVTTMLWQVDAQTNLAATGEDSNAEIFSAGAIQNATRATCSYVQPNTGSPNGYSVDGSYAHETADDFDVPANDYFNPQSFVTNVMLYNPNTVTSLDIDFYSDAAGLPGTALYSLTAQVPTSQTVIGSAFGRDLIQLTFDLSTSGVSLPGGVAGTKYWIGLSEGVDSSGSDNMFVDTTLTVTGTECAFNNAGGGWAPGTVTFGVAADIVMNLTGDCNEPPVISCPADAVADSEPGVCGAVVNFADASAIDAEDGPVATTQTMGPASGTVFPIGVTTIEFSATDSAGATVSCQFTVTVTDIEDPMAVCQDITVELDASGMYALTPADIDGGSTDNCSIASYELVDPNPTSITECGNAPELIPASGTSGPMNPSVANVADSGIIGVNYGVGNVTLNLEHSWASDMDITLTSPAGTVLNLSFGNGGSTGLDTVADLVFTDASGNDITAWNSGAPAADYQAEGGLFNTVFAGEDINGNWTLNIVDNYGGDSGMLNSFCITFAEAATTASLVLTCDNVGTNDVTLLVTDPSGNTSTCTAVVTVEDNQAPVIVCKGGGGAGTLATTLAGGNGNFGNMFDVKAISALTINSFDIHGDTGATFDVEVYAKAGTWVGSETTPGDWTLIGTAAGVASLGDGVVTPLNLSLGYAIPAGETHAFYVTPTDFSTGGFNYTNGTTTGNLFSSDANLEFYEGCGSGYPFNGTIFQPRVFNGNIVYEMPATPPLEVVLDADGMATVDAMDLIFSVDDNCSTVATFGSGGGVSGSLTSLFAAGNNGSPGGAVYFDVTVAASDINITSIDINTADAGAFTMDVYMLAGTYVGNEGNAAAWGAAASGAAGTGAGLDTPSNALLDTPITLTAGTTYGMALVLDATHAHHYTNGDGSNENFSNDDLSMQLGAASNVPFDGSPFSPRVFNGTLNYEAGGGPTMDFDCADLGENMVDVTVTDGVGNEATCTATVIVLDETAPVLVCGPDPLLYAANSVSDSPALAIPDANPAGVTTTVEVTEDFTLTDVNIPVNITHTWRGDLDITVTSPAGTTVVLKTADISDSADDVIVTYDDEGTAGVEALSAFDGESSLGTWTLFVADQFGGDTGTINSWGVEYEYSYPNPETELFIELGPDGTVTIEAEDITSVMEEACGFDVILIDITEFSCDDIGTPTLVTIFANDASGNFASCQVEVNIVDAMAPELVCPDPAMYGTEPSNNDGVYIVRDYYDIGAATYSDNCTDAGSLIVTQTPAPGTQWGINGTGNPGPYEVVFTVEDEYGNISTCTLEVTVTNGIGVTENTLLDNALALYPNPASDQVTLVNTSDIALQTAMIYDLNGKLVADIDLSNMQNETSFDVSDFASGVYMVKIVGENANTVKRLVKK